MRYKINLKTGSIMQPIHIRLAAPKIYPEKCLVYAGYRKEGMLQIWTLKTMKIDFSKFLQKIIEIHFNLWSVAVSESILYSKAMWFVNYRI